jgi:hypothetical protein
MALSGPLHRNRLWAAHPLAPWQLGVVKAREAIVSPSSSDARHGARIMMAAVLILGAIVWFNIRG